MSAAKDRAIHYAIEYGFVVWESPDKTEYQTRPNYQLSPGPGWVKLVTETTVSLADLYERFTTLTTQTTEVVELVKRLVKRVVALEEKA